MDLIDIGANLTHDSFDADREEVVRAAQEVGVSRFVVTGASRKGSEEALTLAQRSPGVMYATAGVHPHHASEYDENVEHVLETLSARSEVVAVGECGLDYFRNFSPVEAQRAAFRAQLEIAVRRNKPVFLHQRDAHDDFVAILEPYMDRLAGGVAHCFTGDRAMLEEYLALGLYIGITGWICDERRGAHLLDAVANIPKDRLMLETDAPYLLPRTLNPKPKTRRNEPKHLVEVLRVVAEATGESEESLAASTTANAERFFGLER